MFSGLTHRNGRHQTTKAHSWAFCVFTMILALGLTAAAQAKQAPAAPEGPALAAELPLVQEGTTWRSALTGRVQAAFGLDEGPFAGDAETAARAFLNAWSEPLGLLAGRGDLRLARVDEVPGGTHVRFQQTKNGVDVWRAGLVVSLNATGEKVSAVQSQYDAALAAALTADPRARLWVVRADDLPGGAARLAYRVVLASEAPAGDWTVRVDAQSGEILGVEDGRVYVDGSGNTFDPDPLTTAEVNYGGNYSDLNDADTPELTAECVPHILPDLTYAGGVYQLQGPYVHVVNFESPNDPPVTSPDPDGFYFTRNAQGFEDVNVYFHIDDSQRHIQALGFTTIQNGPINVDTHGLNGQDNSYYSPAYNRIAYGEGGVDDAEDTDVVVHEYGHAIQSSIVPGWGGGQEGAMGEGFGDYWAGSYSAMISAFRETWVFNWDGHNPFWGGRILNSSLHYPEGLNGQVHHDGQIWSAALFQGWHELGRDMMDQLVLKGHFYLGTYATMAQGAAAIMQGDIDMHNGLHAGTLDYYFTARGFFTAGQYDVPEITHTALEDQSAAGPYPVLCEISSGAPLVPEMLEVVYGAGDVFDHEALLQPTGTPGEYEGYIDDLGGNVDICYYVMAGNTDGLCGTSPRGAEYTHYVFHVAGLAGAPDAAPGDRLSLRLQSNPAVGSVQLQLSLPAAQPVALQIFDPAGRMVRTLYDGELAAGSHAFTWDGRTESGAGAGQGIYWARLATEGGVRVKKLVLSE
jgi:hypothetical protein